VAVCALVQPQDAEDTAGARGRVCSGRAQLKAVVQPGTRGADDGQGNVTVVRVPPLYFALTHTGGSKQVKQQLLAELDASAKRIHSANKQQQQADAAKSSMTDNVVAKLLNNIQLEVTNLHLRYEDDMSIPGSPFSLGLTIAKYPKHALKQYALIFRQTESRSRVRTSQGRNRTKRPCDCSTSTLCRSTFTLAPSLCAHPIRQYLLKVRVALR